MPGGWIHLGRRFFGTLSAEDLRTDEIERIRSLLEPEEFDLFMTQPAIDRRHGYESAMSADDSGGTPLEVRAAALHDIGKRHAGLGIMGRVVASVLIKLRLPLPSRVRMYRDHGPIAAAELAAVGAPSLIVDFTAAHHDRRPASIDPATWSRLSDADDERSRSVMGER